MLPNGDILISLTYGATKAQPRSVTSVLCSFDGDTLAIKRTGSELTHDKGRGLLEPSLAAWQNRFYLTIRAEDERGYVATSDDGLAIFLNNEHAYSERLGQALGQDLKKQWDDYAEDETDKARERARGDDDDDDRVMSFAVYLDGRYRRRLRPGIAIFAIGFAPLGFGLYIGTSLGEGRNVALAGASIGGAMIVGGVLYAVLATFKIQYLGFHPIVPSLLLSLLAFVVGNRFGQPVSQPATISTDK